MYLFREGIGLIIRMLYIAILFVVGSILIFLGLFFQWSKKVREVIAGWTDKLSWYIEDKLNGD